MFRYKVKDKSAFVKCSLTKLMLHHPDLQLDEAVGVETVVLSHAAIANFMATEIQLALWTQGSDFRITDCILLQNVNQAPKRQTGQQCLQVYSVFVLLHICTGLFSLVV